MKEIILSINPCVHGLNYHDPSVAVISNGKILYAVEEERINGIKGSKGLFPINAIKQAMEYCNIKEEDITCISVSYEPDLWDNRRNQEMHFILQKNLSIKCGTAVFDEETLFQDIVDSDLISRYKFFSNKKTIKKYLLEKCGFTSDINVVFFNHHLSHIASSYEVSGFDKAIGIVIDGIGETAVTTIWKIINHEYTIIKQIDYPNSLGYFYAIATKYLGFEPWCHEGKTMALAAYGEFNDNIMKRLSSIFKISDSIYDCSSFIKRNSGLYLMLDQDSAVSELEKLFSVSARKKDEPITDFHMNFAWAVQHILEQSVVELVNWGIKSTGISNVCVAGGIFMNCKMNMIVREKSDASNYFVQPLASDLGLVIGSGLLKSNSYYEGIYNSVSFGPEYSDDEIERAIIASGLSYTKTDDISLAVAQLIEKGNIVCWFEGRMEMGARALGNRSILADPRDPNMSDKINELIKHREKWRPFACSVLDEYCSEILENYDTEKKYPFMIEAFKVKKEWVNKIPAVIHKADLTTRPQSVIKETNEKYHSLISHFFKLTGCPLVLNTSFNDKGQPIIMTPTLALSFVNKNPIDFLAIGSFLVKKTSV